jgi:hypothetical protein
MNMVFLQDGYPIVANIMTIMANHLFIYNQQFFIKLGYDSIGIVQK